MAYTGFLLQALFVVSLYGSAELSPLESLLVPLGIRRADLQDMEQDIKLKIDFPLSVTHPQRAPSRQLHIPRRLEELTGLCFVPSCGAVCSSRAIGVCVASGGSKAKGL